MADILTPEVLIPWLTAMAFGVFVGATPGLTATMAVALIVPISFHMEPNAGLAMIIGVSFTAIFAGDIPATYLRIPGTPASAAATLDGHELAKRGHGRLALSIDLICSAIGGLIGVGLLWLVAKPMATFALKFSDFEYFWLAVLGLSMSAFVSKGSTLLGLISAMLGVLVGTVGMDVVTGVPRYPVLESLGSIELMRGFSFIPVMIGLFGVAEVLRSVRDNVSWSQGDYQAIDRRTSFRCNHRNMASQMDGFAVVGDRYSNWGTPWSRSRYRRLGGIRHRAEDIQRQRTIRYWRIRGSCRANERQ